MNRRQRALEMTARWLAPEYGLRVETTDCARARGEHVFALVPTGELDGYAVSVDRAGRATLGPSAPASAADLLAASGG